jgi:hypothetical protein
MKSAAFIAIMETDTHGKSMAWTLKFSQVAV